MYNNFVNLQECISSIKQQKFTNYEVWIVDGNSSDGTVEFLKTLKAPFHFISEKDNGIYDAMNKGISLSKGEWLYFLGADDKLFDENTLSNISFFKADKDISMIAGKVTYSGNGKPFVYSKSKKIKKSSWSRSIWIRNSIHHQAAFYRKEIFQNRKYNLKYKILADYDLNIKLYKEKLMCQLVGTTIAKCSDKGISKNGRWPIYKEEILVKISNSSQFYYPLFFLIALIKYLLRKFTNV